MRGSLRYRAARDKELDDRNLVPIGYDRHKFDTVGKVQLAKDMLDLINMNMKMFDLDLDVILAGFLDDDARIARISNLGILNWSEERSYDVIGSERLVSTYLELNRYNENMKLPEALLTIYGAKKQAEVSRGVGKFTDIVIITKDGKKKMDEDFEMTLKKALDDEYERTHKRPEPNLARIDEILAARVE